MKIKVNIYYQKSVGFPVSEITSPVYGDSYDDLPRLIGKILSQVESELPDHEVITLASNFNYARWMDIINLQVYLKNLGLVLLVTELTDEDESIPDGNYIEIITPKLNGLPISTVFDMTEDDSNHIISIVDELVNKFNLGDESLVPDSSILKLLNDLKSLRDNGLEILSMNTDALFSELYNYGFDSYYVIKQ